MKHIPTFESFVNEATQNTSQRDSVLSKFKSEIEKASHDEDDIVSAYEEVMDKYKKKYPQFSKDFDATFDKMDADARKELDDMDLEDDDLDEATKNIDKKAKWFDTTGDNFDIGWEICKNHGLTKGKNKNEIKKMRPGHVSYWLADLHKANKLSDEEKKKLGF